MSSLGRFPNLDGNLFNSELCGATFMAMAMALVLRTTSFSWSVIAGALVGMAFWIACAGTPPGSAKSLWFDF